MNDTIAHMGRRVLSGEHLDRPELLELTELSQNCPHDLLYWAWQVRTAHFGNAVRLCSIAAGKLGACSEDCKWCAQSGVSAPGVIKPERPACGQIENAAAEASAVGASSFGIVNSGRKPTNQDINEVINAAEAIRANSACSVGVCASLGELTDETAAALVAAGVTRYNHNLETSRRFYPKVVTTHKYDDRLATVATARRAGMKLCCGGLFGLGENWADRVDLALTLREEVSPDTVPMNFLHPVKGTPLADVTPMSPMEILSTIAIFRMAMPEVDLKMAGGREINLRDLQSWCFYAGATSCLIGNYLTTTGRKPEDDLRMIKDMGLRVVKSFDEATGA